MSLFSKFGAIALCVAIVLPMIGCEQRGEAKTAALQYAAVPNSTPTAEQWQRVAQLRIVFGHQSVGSNILAGVQTLANAQSIPLLVAESREPLPGPGIQHFKVGRNEDPDGKLADFRANFEKSSGAQPDVALLKFCFIDFSQDIDAKRLAQNYIATLDALAASYPQTVFVPMTAPLTTVEGGPRAWLKKLLGKAPGGYLGNARRHDFNAALRAHYQPGQRLFDIAALESNGGRSGIDYQGERIEALDIKLTDDGGHLNDQGQRLLGGALIAHIAIVSQPLAGPL